MPLLRKLRKPLFRKDLNAALSKYLSVTRELLESDARKTQLRERLTQVNSNRAPHREKFSGEVLADIAKDETARSRLRLHREKADALKAIDEATAKRQHGVRGVVRVTLAGRKARAILRARKQRT